MNGNIYPRNPGFQVMHWHEDLQFIYMLEGEIEVVTLETRTSLHAGEGIFINKNVVHLVHKLETCHYNSFIFPDYFLKFYPSSPTSNIVDQLVGKESLPVYLFSLEEKNTAVLQTLQKLCALETHKTPLYPYEILTTLCELWLAFCRVATTSDFSPKKTATGRRMAVFLPDNTGKNSGNSCYVNRYFSATPFPSSFPQGMPGNPPGFSEWWQAGWFHRFFPLGDPARVCVFLWDKWFRWCWH